MKKNEKCLFFVILPQIGLMGTSGDRGIFFTGCPTLKIIFYGYFGVKAWR